MKKLPSRHEEAKESPGYLLWQVSNVWQRHIRAALKPFDLTHVQFVVLAVTTKLGEDHDAVNQADVARAAAIDKMMTSQVVRALVEKGLLERSPFPNDSRSFRLETTDRGLTLISKAIEAVEHADDLFFARLGEEQADFKQALGKLATPEVL